MTTIRDVANHAQVSVATVSRVINNNGYVKDTTKEKVLKSIKVLDYTPNSIARSLFKKKTNTIGMLIPDIENPFFPELFKELEKNANINGYNLLLYNSNYSIEREREFVKLMNSSIIDAAIIVSETLTSNDLKSITIPTVTLDKKISEKITSITANNYEGGKMAVDYLIEKGSSNIIHFSGPINGLNKKKTSVERLRGFKDRMEYHNLTPRVIPGEYNIAKATEQAIDFFNNNKVDGIFAANDLIAVGVIKALAKLEIDYKNLNLIGFDGINIGSAITPEITTLKQPIDKIATKAVNFLLSSRTEKIEHIEYEVTLIERQT